MSQQSTILKFYLSCPGPRAWLVLISDNREPRVVEMWQSSPGIWFARADLVMGEYHCRYYCGDARTVIYYGPAHTEGSSERGMDALVTVKSSDEKGAPRVWPVLNGGSGFPPSPKSSNFAGAAVVGIERIDNAGRY